MIPTRLLGFFLSLLWITVTTSRPKVEVYENTNAVLTCEFQTESEINPRVEWKKKGNEVSYIYFNGEFIGSFKDRASINGATVTLYGVSVKDSGVYICEVTARYDMIILGEVTVSLNVLVPSHTPSCEVPETAVNGSPVKLHCEDKLSVPPVNYSWYKDNKPLITALASSINYSLDVKTGTLKFQSVSQSDAGQYRCEASNGIRGPVSCVGQHMTITESESNLTLVTLVGAAFLIFSCSLAVCLCCQKSCCHHEKNTRKDKRNVNNRSSPTNPNHFKHTQSFMV